MGGVQAALQWRKRCLQAPAALPLLLPMGFLATLLSQMVGHGQAESAPPTPQQAAAQSTAMIQVRPRPRSEATDSVSVTSLAQASSKNLLSSNLELSVVCRTQWGRCSG